MALLPYSAETYNRAGADELRRRLVAGAALLAQGPMGTMLMSEPGGEDIPAAYWNVAEPQVVTRLHSMYDVAGAEVLITNTLCASAPALARDEVYVSMAEVNRAGVECARRVAPQLLLGSMGPCGLEWFEPDGEEFRSARAAYRDQAYALLCAGADGLLLETFTSIRDLEPALAGAFDVADGMPLLVSFAIDDDANLLGDGLNIEGAVVYAEKHGADSVGVNCCSIDAANVALPRLLFSATTPVTVRPSAGAPHRDDDGQLAWDDESDAFALACVRWYETGAALVGACCGATPNTTCAMAAALDRLS